MSAILIETERSFLAVHDIEAHILDLISECVNTCEPLLEKNPPLTLYGKTVYQRRSVGFFSDESIGYKYSKKLMPSQALPECLSKILNYVNGKFNYDFNGILINKYDDGNEYISKHSDDEAGLNPSVGVIAISYGAVRTFRIRNKKTNDIELDLPTHPTKMIQMYGDFQKEFTHEIPVEKKVVTPRYSLTFRRHLE